MEQVQVYQEDKSFKQVSKYWIYMHKNLGKGQFSEVYLSCCQEDKQMYAAKIYNMKWLQSSHEQIQSMVKKEIDLLKQVKHDNLVTLHDIQMTPNNLYLFLDYCNGGTLRSYLEQKGGKLFHDQALQFFKQIIIGYQELYCKKIIHRDLKPENILLNDGKPKIGDFGFGRIMEGSPEALQAMSIKCTPVYASPQMLKQEMYSSKNDVWAMGVILYEMIYGKRPFDQCNPNLIIKDMEKQLKQANRKLIMPQDQSVLNMTKDLIQKMLMFEESERISWPEIFVHPIIKDNFQTIINQEVQQVQQVGHIKILVNNRNEMLHNLIMDKHYIKKRPRIFNDNDEIRRVQTEVQSTQLIGQQKILQTPIKQQQILDISMNQTTTTNVSKQTFSVANSLNIDNKLQNEYQSFKMKEMVKFACQNMNKLIMFNRNRAIFAYTVLQYFLDVQAEINFNDVVNYAIYYCLGGFYQFYLNYYQQIMMRKIVSPNMDQDDFVLYCKSELYQETLQKLQKDIEYSTSFFNSIESIALNGLPKYSQYQFSDNCKQCFINIIELAKKKEITDPQVFNKILETILEQQIDRKTLKQKNQKILKSIYGMLIFTRIDQFIPLNQFFEFDFGKFYSENLINATQEELNNKIIAFFEKK